MNVFKTEFKGTEIRCIDLPFTNDTLVVAPSIEGRQVSIIVSGKQIAEKITKSKKMLEKVFTEIMDEHNLFRRLVTQ
jgi:hypothetical protein